MRNKNFIWRASIRGALFFLVLNLVACATYQGKVSKARDKLPADPAAAARDLAPLAQAEGKDQLVYLLDYATALQVAGDAKESARQFIAADRLADAKDYLSLSKFTASLLFNQEQVPYRGDDFELMMINAMNALNYLAMNDLEGALVETRRINEKVNWISQRAKKPFQKNPFAVYLAALIWEADRRWDDAFLDFKSAYALDPYIPFIKEDLVRAAARARRTADLINYQKEFGIKEKPEWNVKKWGSVVVIHLSGWGPRKHPRRDNFRFPMLAPFPGATTGSVLLVDGVQAARSHQVYSVEEAAIKTLESEYGELVAKRMAGIVAKEVVSDQVSQRNKNAGAILNLVMHLSDRADLRQWSTLPGSVNLIRKELTPGTHQILLRSEGSQVRELGPKTIVVKPGKTEFLVWRTF